jgi:hypothetical protein
MRNVLPFAYSAGIALRLRRSSEKRAKIRCASKQGAAKPKKRLSLQELLHGDPRKRPLVRSWAAKMTNPACGSIIIKIAIVRHANLCKPPNPIRIRKLSTPTAQSAENRTVSAMHFGSSFAQPKARPHGRDARLSVRPGGGGDLRPADARGGLRTFAAVAVKASCSTQSRRSKMRREAYLLIELWRREHTVPPRSSSECHLGEVPADRSKINKALTLKRNYSVGTVQPLGGGV